MGKAALIMVMGAFFVYAISNVSVFSSLNQAQDVAFEFYEEVQARNIASSMVEILKQRLKDDVNMRDTIIQTEYLFDAEIGYRVIDTLLNGEDLIMIDVVAKYPDYGDNPMQKRIINYLQMNSPILQTLEYNYAVFGGGGVVFSGERCIVADSCNPSINANVYSGGMFAANTSASPCVEGFVDYTTGYRVNTAPLPNSNPDGDPVARQVSNLEFGTFNHADFIAIADSVHEGYFIPPDGFTLGTKEDPMLIYINGDFAMSGSVPEIFGYGIFIVNGRVIFTGSGLVNGDPDPTESNLIFFATDIISMSGSVEVYASFYSLNQVVMSGMTKVHGTVHARYRAAASGGYDPYTGEHFIPHLLYRPSPLDLVTRVVERQMEKSLKSVYYYE